MSRITFNEYARGTEFTANYPEHSTGSTSALLYACLGLGGETGEVLDQVKKILRDDGGVLTAERKSAIKAEIGDVFWYLARVCIEADINPEETMKENLEKLADRLARGVIHGDGDNR
jgi:NTP pyrophosphatase (non-canonical NTP hydrolase)